MRVYHQLRRREDLYMFMDHINMFLSFFSLFRDFNAISVVDYNIVMFFIQAIADFPTAINGVHAIIH